MVVEFTLTYDGALPSNGRPQQKHDIRKALHPQLKELWYNPPLQDYLSQTEQEGKALSTVDGHGFTAIVNQFFQFRAKLDILILKPEQPGGIVLSGGDIDNRLKTLFDAMTRPAASQDVPSDWIPESEEKPLHCLLEDDGLITSVNVRTSRLLNPTQPTHVKVVVDVSVSTRHVFGGFAILAP
jgi:hypothetical protein